MQAMHQMPVVQASFAKEDLRAELQAFMRMWQHL